MNRRRYLATLGVAALAGCIQGPDGGDEPPPPPPGTDTPADTTAPDPEPEPTPTPDETTDYRSAFVSDLESAGVTVEDASVEAERAIVRARLSSDTESAVRDLVAGVTHAYARTVERGWPVALVETDALTDGGETAATFSVKRIWARQYSTGELTQSDYRERAIGTLSLDRTLLADTTPISGDPAGSAVTPMFSMGYRDAEDDEAAHEFVVEFTYRAQRAIDPTPDDGRNWTPGEGEDDAAMKWLVLRVRLTLDRGEDATFDPRLLYVNVDGEDYGYEELDDHTNPLTDHEFEADESAEGYLYYAIPDSGDTASLRVDRSGYDEPPSVVIDYVNEEDTFPVELPVYAG